MKNTKKSYNASKNGKFKPGFKKRDQKCIVTFDDKDRQEYLTGFHKRKVERKKLAVAELQKKIKEEQKKVKEERHKTYMKMLKERREALEEDQDDLEEAIIGTTESIQYDHPNHTVTVTTINDLDLTGPSSFLLGPAASPVHGENKDEKEGGEEREENMVAMPKNKNNPILNKKIRNLAASLSSHTKSKKRKGKQGKQEGRRGRTTADKKHTGEHAKTRPGKTTKKERRRRQGNRRYQD